MDNPDRDFVCYTMDGWDIRIRPAEPTREWMDGTPLGFANRCLPLNIANAHGWEIITHTGFSAYWCGGDKMDDVIIKPDGTQPARSLPVSIFGSGTLTFHVDGIFRTPPGWNLMAGGSPNWAKDGIAPLTGIIETDWSPYTFTMNWRFTRRNHWVRWEAGEPFCFIMPVQRGVLEEFQPRIAPMSEDPDLQRQFTEWTKSRTEFHAYLKRERPQKQADQWQRGYMRGLDQDGKKPVDDHQSRLRLRPFTGGKTAVQSELEQPQTGPSPADAPSQG